jgi:hypothetical protein
VVLGFALRVLQAYLNHTPALSCFSYFSDRISYYVSFAVRITDMRHHIWLGLLVEMGASHFVGPAFG